MSAINREEIIKEMEESAQRFVELSRLSSEKLAQSYAPGKWTARQLIAHLADCEVLYAYRIMLALSEPGKNVQGIDPDGWMNRLDGASRPVDQSVATVRTLRAFLIYLARTSSDELLAGEVIHSEKGPMSAVKLFQTITRHMHHHCDQIEAIRDGKEWKKK